MQAGMPANPATVAVAARRQRALVATLLTTPFLLFYAVFFVLPLIGMLYLSFTDNSLGNLAGNFVGLHNYAKLVQDPKFWRATLHTLYFVLLTVIPNVAVGLILALLVERLGRLRRLVEGIFFLPVILSLGTIGLIWSWMLDPQYGVINSIFHLTTFWTGSYRFAMPTVAVVTIWWSAGFNMLLYEAGLSSIPKEISEAARIDGATTGQVFRYITLPLLKPTTTLILILQLIASMNIFGQVYLLTGGGPNNSTRVLLEYMYTVAFTKQEGGYGSAIAVGIFVIILVISVIQYTVLNAGASAASRA
jgi:multiple sugar transport system permease protein